MAAPETKAAIEQARMLIERAEALGEPAGNPQLLLVLNGFWLANHVAFNGDALRELAAQFLALAEKQGAIIPLIRGHRLMGVSLMCTGDIVEGRAHFDRAVALCDQAERPPVGDRQDCGCTLCLTSRFILCPIGRWPCGRLAILKLLSRTFERVAQRGW